MALLVVAYCYHHQSLSYHLYATEVVCCHFVIGQLHTGLVLHAFIVTQEFGMIGISMVFSLASVLDRAPLELAIRFIQIQACLFGNEAKGHSAYLFVDSLLHGNNPGGATTIRVVPDSCHHS
jgi:hypothetical protein